MLKQGETTGLWVEFKNHDAEMRKKLQKTKVLEKTPIETTIETPMKTTMKNQKTHMKILETIALNPNITIPALAKQFDRSESAVWRSIQKLQKEAYLK